MNIKGFSTTTYQERGTLPDWSGIYLVEVSGRIVYVGASGRMKARLNQHGIFKKVNRDDALIHFCKCPPSRRAALERRMIKEFRPTFNINPPVIPKKLPPFDIEKARAMTVIQDPLTPKQQRIFDFIASCIRNNGWSPTLSEIAKGLGINGTANVYNAVCYMLSNGHLIRDPRLTSRYLIPNANPDTTTPKGEQSGDRSH
jgi:hypothetical protein